jgi:hypothetical protein
MTDEAPWDVGLHATMLLCDHAQVADGKLFVSGGGWSIVDAGTPHVCIALLLAVPWDRINRPLEFALSLHDGDGRAVLHRTEEGPREIVFGGRLEVGRPPDLPPGASIDVPIVVSVPPMQLEPGARYTWDLAIDGEHQGGWRLPFSTRPV